MRTLVFDIETKARAWGDLPGMTRSALTHWIERGQYTESVRQEKLAAVQGRLDLSPFTAEIIALAVYDVEDQRGAVYYVAAEPAATVTKNGVTYKVRSEQELLTEFWDGARQYQSFVSFNGRSFTVPFLYHRSVMLEVMPQVAIARQRYLSKQTAPYHIDLLDELSFHGAMPHRPSLALLCSAYGIDHSSVLGGEEVADAYTAGRYQTVAEKCAGDVEAITALYGAWKQYLAPKQFIEFT
ncbi:MAG: ribonuclease H-like domain-containing protein [Patescibacteria group bacterium]